MQGDWNLTLQNLTKTPLIYSASYQLGELGTLFEGAKPTKAFPWRLDPYLSLFPSISGSQCSNVELHFSMKPFQWNFVPSNIVCRYCPTTSSSNPVSSSYFRVKTKSLLAPKTTSAVVRTIAPPLLGRWPPMTFPVSSERLMWRCGWLSLDKVPTRETISVSRLHWINWKKILRM